MWKLRLLKNSLSAKKNFGLLFVISLSTVLFSFFIEIGLRKEPCMLCKIQRILYILLGISSLLGMRGIYSAISKRCCIGLLLALCLTASYHSLVQFGVLKDRCQIYSKVSNPQSYKELLLAPNKAQSTCSEKSLAFRGIPLSSMNVLISFSLILTLKRAKFRELLT